MWTILIQTFSTMITHPEPALHLFLSKEEKVLQDLGNQGEKGIQNLLSRFYVKKIKTPVF